MLFCNFSIERWNFSRSELTVMYWWAILEDIKTNLTVYYLYQYTSLLTASVSHKMINYWTVSLHQRVYVGPRESIILFAFAFSIWSAAQNPSLLISGLGSFMVWFFQFVLWKISKVCIWGIVLVSPPSPIRPDNWRQDTACTLLWVCLHLKGCGVGYVHPGTEQKKWILKVYVPWLVL